MIAQTIILIIALYLSSISIFNNMHTIYTGKGHTERVLTFHTLLACIAWGMFYYLVH